MDRFSQSAELRNCFYSSFTILWQILPLKCKNLSEAAIQWNQKIAEEISGQFFYINKIKLLK